MQNWYYIENTAKDAENLLHMFWEFHDFHIQSLSHNPKENTVDLVLEYDSAGLRVKLRFVDVYDFNFGPMSYDPDFWIMDAALFITDSNAVIWALEGEIKCEEEISEHDTWVKSEKLHYAVIDENDNPKEIPAYILNRESRILNYKTHKYDTIEAHFSPKKLPAKSQRDSSSAMQP